MTVINITLRPHVERAGYHTERFAAYLDEQLVCTSRSGWHDPARALLALGYPPDTLLHVQHAGKPHDPTIVAKPLGELAKWTIAERDKVGLRRELWRPGPAERAIEPAGRQVTARADEVAA